MGHLRHPSVSALREPTLLHLFHLRRATRGLYPLLYVDQFQKFVAPLELAAILLRAPCQLLFSLILNMQIQIRRIQQEDQRYDTLGDWFYDEHGTLQIKATAETDDESFLIALHELVEAWLCKKRGVAQDTVDAFDFEWTVEHPQSEDEPGDDPRAPYRAEHRFAAILEHLMAHELGVINYGVVK